MRYMTSDEIRDCWLRFFASKGHFIEPSASLIPHNDPTLLWINSGVAALKKYFDGSEQPPHRRLTNAQKAIRTNDIDNVGHTARHHTFFEMLGNFSIGDYFRNEIIPWAVELLTDEKYFGFPREKLYITYHPDDTASRDLWIKNGISASHLVPLESNFWEVGPGPSGPDTEIYFDRGEEYDPSGRGEELLRRDIDNDRYIEIWNIVFSQYNAEPGVKPRSQYKELPQKNIDTGAGLERLACVLQGARTNFETDLFKPYIDYLAARASLPYEGANRYSYQVIADHIRSLTFALADGAVFANEGRGYVLKRLVRRLVRQADILGIPSDELPNLVDLVAETMKHFYPYLQERAPRVKKMIQSEIGKFVALLRDGEKRICEELEKCGPILSGAVAFTLQDTYGIPVDLTIELAERAGKSVDLPEYERLLSEQKEKARLARGNRKSFGSQSPDLLAFTAESKFLYEEVAKLSARVIGLFKDGQQVEVLTESGEMVLDQTTFYAESGGQVADIGAVRNEEMEARVTDVVKAPHKQFLHTVEVLYGSIRVGDELILEPDYQRRNMTRKNHSSAHLLQKALQEILGPEVHQEGSFVSPEEMRFDFNYDGRIDQETLDQVESRVNEVIASGLECSTQIMDKDEALKTGAMALFDEKYDSEVRVVSFGDFSKEFCAGTHVFNTRDILHFAITSCSAIAAGVKRITACTGLAAYRYRKSEEHQLDEIAEMIQVKSRKEIFSKLRAVSTAKTEAEEKCRLLESKIAGLYTAELLSQMKADAAVSAAIGIYDELTHEQLNQIARGAISGERRAVLLVARRAGKSEFAVGLSADLTSSYKAGNIVREIGKILNGSGGGKPDLAFGGTSDLSHLSEAKDAFLKVFA